MDYKSKLETDGYFILKNVFSKNEINSFRDCILNYAKNNKTLENSKGSSIPDFIKIKELESITNIKNNKKLLSVLDNLFDNDYRFCSHNDIGIDRRAGLHKDILMGRVAKYRLPPWDTINNERQKIIKIGLYLQDHSQNNQCMQLVPKSHLEPKISSKGLIQLHPSIGDILIFDQRITHRGPKTLTTEKTSHRILVSFGFGKNNIFTDKFEIGTIARQNHQNRRIKKTNYIHKIE